MSSRTTSSVHGAVAEHSAPDPDSDAKKHLAETHDTRVHSISEWESSSDVPQIPPTQNSRVNAMGVALVHFTQRLIFPFFLITGGVAAAATLLAYFNILLDRFSYLIITVAVTWIISFVAMFGVWRWGAAEEYIEFAKIQNEHFKASNEKLGTIGSDLKQEVQSLQDHVSGLERETIQLEQCMASFEELQQALEEISGDDEEILKFVDELNEQYSRMKILTMERDKAQLLLTYYKVQFSGENDKFTKNDYERFVGRLNKSTKELYDDNGGFEALDLNNDGQIDPEEFIKVTEMVLGNNEEIVRRLSTRVLTCGVVDWIDDLHQALVIGLMFLLLLVTLDQQNKSEDTLRRFTTRGIKTLQLTDYKILNYCG